MSRPLLEVADVVRQYGDAFLARYGPTLSGAQHRALPCAPSRCVARLHSGAISPSATTVGTKCRRITPAATAAARNVMGQPGPPCWRPGRTRCSPLRTSM
jgi:hypothetical protein